MNASFLARSIRTRRVGIHPALFITILGSTAGVAGLIYLADRVGATERYGVYVLSLISVGLAAYAWVSPAPSLLLAAFFESIFLWQFTLGVRQDGITIASLQLLVIALSVVLVVPLMSGMAGVFRGRRRLSDAVNDLDALLVRSADLDEVFGFLLAHMTRWAGRDGALILHQDPADARWELITPAGLEAGSTREDLGWLGASSAAPLSLAAWLVSGEHPVLIGDLGGDPRFVAASRSQSARSTTARRAARGGSLAACPVRDTTGALRGVLVLIDPHAGAFGRDHLAALGELAALAEKALPQAGLYLLADRALARRAGQLAALQRAAKELNAALDIGRIAELALDCARDLTRADAGLARIALPGLAPAVRVSGALRDDARIALAVARASELDGPAVDQVDDSPEALGEPVLLPDCAGRLLAPIQREGRFLGALILESRLPLAFDDQDAQVMASLADHVAVALENAYLFEEIRGERVKSGQIIETMADGLLAADTGGEVMAFNPAAELLTGWRRADAIGRQLCEVLGCGGELPCAEECRLMAVLHGGGVLRDEQRTIRTRDGTRRVISLSASTAPLNGDLRQGLVVLARDVTQREEMESFQRELVATFSHDLRAPLTNISVLVDMLANAGLETGQVNAEYLNSLRGQSRRLTDLVERTLDLSRLDAGQWRLEPRPVPLLRLVEEVVTMWREAAAGRELCIEPPAATALWVWADERAVVTALSNLIDNALKYSEPGTPVRVSLAPAQTGEAAAAAVAAEAIIAVHNQGPAIAAEHQTRIFERFYRVDRSDSRRVYGFGLGLYIARKLVEEMGGRIWVVSEPATGTRFIFTAPLVQEDQLETADR